ncbi:hypothetical protein QEN41_16345 [Gordonia alkanivorans]|uniref:hypothetical protein n=1 Tax=Gordonia alkanivorans TaxID=84096 RepID=UPI00244BE2CA|nr:hypothetical protein [Gordonia alkanivorans]MDH3021553.1 hypothetical protein [Gordonia alkanivorans]MDJ0027470.1 hypothetical protein [Gordonia alkanivorans]
MSSDPHGALRDALTKALESERKTTPPANPKASSLDDAVAHHYTPKKDNHDD